MEFHPASPHFPSDVHPATFVDHTDWRPGIVASFAILTSPPETDKPPCGLGHRSNINHCLCLYGTGQLVSRNWCRVQTHGKKIPYYMRIRGVQAYIPKGSPLPPAKK